MFNVPDNTKSLFLNNQPSMARPTLSIQILMNTIKDYVAIHIWLIYIDVPEVVIPLMIHPIIYISQTKAYLRENLRVFDMVTGINESKTLAEHISCKCKCKYDGKNVVQMKSGITINVGVSAKKIMCVKSIISGIVLHALVKTINM